MSDTTDEARTARIKSAADVLCGLMNDAAAAGLHVGVKIQAYQHSITHELGNLASDFKADVSAYRVRYL